MNEKRDLAFVAIFVIVFLIVLIIIFGNSPKIRNEAIKFCPADSCDQCVEGSNTKQIYCCQLISNHTAQCNLLELVYNSNQIAYFRTLYK